MITSQLYIPRTSRDRKRGGDYLIALLAGQQYNEQKIVFKCEQYIHSHNLTNQTEQTTNASSISKYMNCLTKPNKQKYILPIFNKIAQLTFVLSSVKLNTLVFSGFPDLLVGNWLIISVAILAAFSSLCTFGTLGLAPPFILPAFSASAS